MQPTSFISIDWGTTSLRARLVECNTLRIISQVNNGKGIKELHRNWQLQGGDKEAYLLNYLTKVIIELGNGLNANTIVVISGMASATIGLRTLAYAALPFALNGNDVVTAMWQPPNFPYKILLISGVCSANEVLRGEEVQVLGMQRPGFECKAILYILPGTHSKHVYCKNGLMHHFTTFMTGELFDTIIKHTILSLSITKTLINKEGWSAFDAGVKVAQSNPSLLSTLFQIRINTLFDKLSPGENYYYLSGLLIGSELVTINAAGIDELELCANEEICAFYTRALVLLGFQLLISTEGCLPPEVFVVRGQWQVIKHVLNNNKQHEPTI